MQARGFTLVEVLVALALLLLAALATAQTLILSAAAVRDTRVQTLTAAAAAQRAEQLLALEWTAPELVPSPAGALDQNTDGYVDFLDGDGRVLAAGTVPPAEAAFVRRWAIDPPATGVADALVIRVVARSLAADLAGVRGGRGEARLVTVRARVDR